MKTLQNNFTTPEQSKRLVKLGVPAYSADCYFQHAYNCDTGLYYYDLDQPIIGKREDKKDIPCWSVGRLIEIACKYWNGDHRVILFPNIGIHNNNIMEYVFHYIECDIQLGCFDFSKLEE